MGKKAKRRQKKQVKQRKIPKANPIRKIRVGYISADLGNIPEADFLPAFFAAHDKALFTVMGFNVNPPDEVTRIFVQGADDWQDISSMDSGQAAELIEQQKLDFLVDISLNESSKVAEILSLQPASSIRKISSWCYTPFDKNKEYCVTAPSLFEGYVTFGILGSLFASPELLPQVMELLLAVPDSCLLLAAEDTQICQCEEISRELRELGLSNRILLAEGSAYPYEKIDIFLGAAGVTAHDLCHTYNRSIPVILYAEYAEREAFVTEVLEKAGQTDLCAQTTAGYKELALELAKDKKRLRRLHRHLHDEFQASALMDLDRYILDLERSYLRDYMAGQSQDSEKLLAQAMAAIEAKDWSQAVCLFSGMAVRSENFPEEHYLDLAWAYFFLKDNIRSFFWAKEAEKFSKPITALYLQTEILVKANRYEEAWQVIEKAYALAQQGNEMLPEIQESMTIKQASIAYRVGRPEATELYWQVYTKNRNFYDRCMGYSSWLLTHNNMDVDWQELYTRHLGYNALFKDVTPFTHMKIRHRHDKLRIGYISPDFRAHVMSHFLWPFLATYDHDNFTVYVYSIGKEDQYTKTFKTLVDEWRELGGVAYEEIAQKIYEDEVDILFDLAGHTSNSGLPVLAYKPAPIQISGLGYMATTGLSTVDYFLTDGYVDPPGRHDEFFSEKLLRLTTQFCYTGEENWPESTEAPCRKRGWIIFGVFNNFGKITEEMLTVWREILLRVPRSQLLLKGNVLCDRLTVKRICAEWEAKGLPMDRIIFEPASTDYMLRYLDVDIALDTYPYPGGGTTCDALYMGVPVVTRYGERHSTRFGYGMLGNIGLTELTAVSDEEYIEKAVALATDWELLDMFHQKLRQFMKKSPLMDVVSYMQEVEAVYQRIWQEYKWRQT